MICGSVLAKLRLHFILICSVPQDTGISKGKNYSLNFPLRDGITDESYKSVFEPVNCLLSLAEPIDLTLS